MIVFAARVLSKITELKPSCRFTMVVTQHSVKSLAPFNRCMSLAYRTARFQQAVFYALMISLTMIVC